MRQIVFMSSNGLMEAFTVSESAEVKRASPAIFVKICDEIIVVLGKGGVLYSPCLIDCSAR